MSAPHGPTLKSPANLDDGYLHQDTMDAILNLAIAKVSDRTFIAQLTVTVARLMMEIDMVNDKIIISLQAKRVSHISRGEHNISACRQGARAVAKAGEEVRARAVART